MPDDTIEPDMPQQDTDTTIDELSDNSTRIKLLASDADLAQEIVARTRPILRGITLTDILREAVTLGLPLVDKKMQAACAAIKKTH